MHLVMQHILSMFLHNIKHVLNQERNIIIHVILKKNKTTQNKIFMSFWKFSMFLDFSFNNQNILKTREPKTESKHVYK